MDVNEDEMTDIDGGFLVAGAIAILTAYAASCWEASYQAGVWAYNNGHARSGFIKGVFDFAAGSIWDPFGNLVFGGRFDNGWCVAKRVLHKKIKALCILILFCT